MGTVAHRDLRGHVVEFDLPEVSVPDKYTSPADVLIDEMTRGICAGPPDHSLVVAGDADMGRVSFEEEYAFQDGTLRIGWSFLLPEGDDPDYVSEDASGNKHPVRRWFASWEGAHSSFHSQLMGPAESDRLLGFLTRLRFLDTPLGLMMRMGDGGHPVYAGGPSIVKWIPDVGVVESSPLDAKHTRRPPSWEGTKVRGGELFHAQLSNDAGHYFVLVGRSTISWIIPNEAVATDAVLDRVSEMIVKRSAN